MDIAWRHLGDVSACAKARDAVISDGSIFVAGEDGRVLRLNPDGLGITPVDCGWRSRFLAAARGLVYSFDERGPLYAVGLPECLDGDFSEMRIAAGNSADLFAADNRIHAIDPDGTTRALGTSSFSPRLLVPGERLLYCLEENGSLHRVDLHEGSAQQIDGDWGDVTAGTLIGDNLYLASLAGWMYAVLPTGEFVPLECGAPTETRFLLTSGTTLYALETDGALHILQFS